MKKERNINLDIIRVFAFLSVISVHFFLHSGFYNDDIFGIKDYFIVSLREFFMICVPLFILLTGYLNTEKEVSKGYYKSIIPKLFIYVLAAICQLLLMKYYQNENLTLKSSINMIINFNIHYGWYMNMYIGLYLLIPFLNLIYKNLKNINEKKTLIIIFIILTCIPTILGKHQFLLSNWWIILYPITYYFIGCYIKEYGLKISKILNIILLIAFIFGYGIINYRVADGGLFQKLSYNHEWGGVMPFTLSILVFNLLLNIKFKQSKIFSKLSSLVFAGYLVEWIFDRIAYDFLNARVTYESRIYYFIICILFVFICSLIVSYILNLIVKLITRRIYEKN